MEKSLIEIAKFLDGKIAGDSQVVITGFSGLKEAKSGDLSFLANAKYADLLNETQASAVLVSNQENHETEMTLIKVDNPSLAFSRVLSLFIEPPSDAFKGVHSTAIIAETAEIGKDVNIGPYVVLEDGVEIGDRTTIGAGTFVGFKSTIGRECLIYPNVSILHKTSIGNRVIIHSGTVVGSDGFGFATGQDVHEKIPQIGIVEIDDDVEIGSNVTIDRARFDRTSVGAGTKIDNLVQIAHNVKIGKNCLIVAQAGIAGSTMIEDYVVIGGQVGVAGHITVGSGTRVAAQSGIVSSVEPKSILFGSPAQPHMKEKRVKSALNKLPEYLKVIRGLQKKVEELEKKIPEKT